MSTEKTNKPIPVEKKKTVSDEFMEELDNEERGIFLDLKSALMNKCDLLDFEAVNEDNLDDWAAIITYTKNGVLEVCDDGIKSNLRKPIKNDAGIEITKSVTVLYEKNENREKALTQKIKVSKKNIESQKLFTRACLAASFKSIDFEGKSLMISTNNTKHIHNKDYMLLLTVYNLFRN